MKREKLFILILFCVGLPYQSISQNGNDTVKQKLISERQIKLDTLRVQNFNKEISEKKWYENNNISWGVSLLIGITTIIVSWRVTVRNNKNSKELALAQIKSAKELAITDFQATLKSQNWQDWIKEVRLCLTEYLVHNKMLNIEYQDDNTTIEKIKIYIEKTGYNYNKIHLLLNDIPHNLEQKKLLDLIKQLSSLLDSQYFDYRGQYFDELKKRNSPILDKQGEILTAAIELIDSEWKKTQSLENK